MQIRPALALPLCLMLAPLAACDSGGPAKEDEKSEAAPADEKADAADTAASDEKAETPPEEAPTTAAPEAGETGTPEPEAAGETGEAEPAPEAGGDGDGDGDGGKKAGTEKKSGGNAEQIALGKDLFGKKCKTCHGNDGKGSEKFKAKVPDLPSLAKTKLSKAKARGIIADGVPDTKMKAYKSKLSDDEIDALAAFVKTL